MTIEIERGGKRFPVNSDIIVPLGSTHIHRTDWQEVAEALVVPSQDVVLKTRGFVDLITHERGVGKDDVEIRGPAINLDPDLQRAGIIYTGPFK